MPRPPKPFRRPDRDGYWTKAGGQWQRLGDTKSEAQAALHQLLATRGRAAPSGRITVAELIDLWLDARLKEVKPRTWERYRDHAQSLVDHCGRLVARDLRPLHITAWLKANPGWKSENTRALAASIAKMAFRWAALEGWLDRNPLELLRVPKGDPRPPAPPGAAEALPNGIRSEPFRRIFEFMIATGCRPGEARTLEASRIDLAARVALVTGKTGQRLVYLPESLLEPLGALCAAHPTGPIFLNCHGRPWQEKALQCQFSRCSKRSGGGRVQPYHTRGTFATNAVRNGVDSAVVAKLLGHADVDRIRMLVHHYLHPEADDLRDAADKAQGKDPAG